MSDFLWRFILLFATHSQTIIKACTAVGAVATALTTVIPFVKRHVVRRPLQPLIKQEKYLSQVIKQATFNYIEPNCQSVDPSGHEEFRKVIAAKEPAFSVLDEMLDSVGDEKFTMVLADTGMGKTSLLLNYYSRHLRRRNQRFKLALVPLGQPRAAEQIDAIDDKDETALLLDALDEDTLAIKDHRQRLAQLLQLASGFRYVLITCRTQFFGRDDEIPRETGLIRTGITRGGQDKEYTFRKLYLSPFSDKQVKRFVSQSFPFWRWGDRRKAQAIIRKMPDLTVRPMLLAHVGDLIRSSAAVFTSASVYEEMVRSWLARERHFVDPKVLLEFSEVLAADVYLNRKERGSEKIPRAEALAHAKELKFDLTGWQIAGRSLLNRDGDGNLKFAHRSIMEYLFIRYFLRCPSNVGKSAWTDQMKVFWWEILFLSNDVLAGGQLIWDERRKNADTKQLDRLHLPSVINLRAAPQQVKCEQLSEYVQKIGHASGEQAMQRPWPQLYVRVPIAAEQGSGMATGGDATLDVVTGLMWEAACSAKPLTFAEAAKHVVQLRTSKHGGFSDWRVPTVPEVLSLLPTDLDGGPDTRLTVFTNLQSVLWTSDRTGESDDHWRIDVNPGVLIDLRTATRLEALRGPAYLRAVRSYAGGFTGMDG